MRRKNGTLVKVLILTPYLIVLYILQSTVFTRLTVFGAKPLLLPLAAAGVALFRGRTEGGVFSLFSGMLLDLSFNQNTVEFTLILTFTGLLIGILSDTVLVQGFPSYFVCAALALVICTAFQLLELAVLSGAPLSATLPTALWQILGSLIFAVPLYYISRFLCRVI